MVLGQFGVSDRAQATRTRVVVILALDRVSRRPREIDVVIYVIAPHTFLANVITSSFTLFAYDFFGLA